MHENREISRTPWSDDQGRSAKATNQTADTHVPEKSDCAVLPVNQPNKGGQPSAEAGDGRAQTRENIVQSHMHPTQSGKRMSQGLDGVRKAAKERKQEREITMCQRVGRMGLISVDGPGQKNPDRSESPWGGVGPPLQGGASRSRRPGTERDNRI